MEKALASHADAELILKLYELRTEAVMRQARAWFLLEFWPETAAEFFVVLNEFGSQRNAYLRQVVSYWEMAAALVLHGAVSADLFLDTNGEPFFYAAKLAHILPEIHAQRPTYMGKVLKLVEIYPAASTMFEAMKKNIAHLREARKKA
jgi:hypothetical protein